MTNRSRIRPRRTTRRSLALAAILTGMISLAGCLLTSSFDDVAGVRPADAAPPVDDAVPDGSDEAAETGEGGAPPFSCATQAPAHFICSDFDEGSITAGGWTLSQSAGGSARLDTAQFASPPAALIGRLPAVLDTTTASGILFQNIKNLVPKGVHMAFDMRIGSCQAMTGGSITLAVIAPVKAVTFGFVIQSNNAFAFAEQITVDGGRTFTPHALSTMPAAGVWTRVKLDVTFTPAKGSASVRLDDKEVLKTDVSGVTPDGSPVLLNIGTFSTGPNFPCDVDFDNVTFDPDL